MPAPRRSPTSSGPAAATTGEAVSTGSATTASAADTRAVLRRLRELGRALEEHSRWVESQCGLSALQLGALRALAARPGMKVSELAADLLIHQSTASNMLDKLEAKGLLHRQRVGPDQRVVRLQLTAAGTDMLATAPHPDEGGLRAALRRLPPDILARLAADLGEVAANLKPERIGTSPLAARGRDDR